MATRYRIYANDLAGGPVDYTTPIGTTAGLTFSPPALSPGADATFAVRAYDDVSGLEESNVDARVRVRLDASGADLAARPLAPVSIAVRPVSGGLLVAWGVMPSQVIRPTGYRVRVTAGATVNYAAAANATVPHADAGRGVFAATVTGLAAGDYAVGVTAYVTAGEGDPVVSAGTVPSGTPAAVTGLAAAVRP